MRNLQVPHASEDNPLWLPLRIYDTKIDHVFVRELDLSMPFQTLVTEVQLKEQICICANFDIIKSEMHLKQLKPAAPFLIKYIKLEVGLDLTNPARL